MKAPPARRTRALAVVPSAHELIDRALESHCPKLVRALQKFKLT